MERSRRVQGLDIIRSSAVIFVFLWHYPRLNKQVLGGVIGNVSWSAVDMFFVLSGYLIGQQLFSSLKKGRFHFRPFILKRLLRTLPNYYFVLILVFLFPGIDGKSYLPDFWKFFTFTQNYGLITSSFSHAWSLCVEEQFYLFLPFVSLLFHQRLNATTVALVIVLLFLGSAFLRYLIWSEMLSENLSYFRGAFFTRIYYPTYTRLDGLTAGVTLALIKVYRPQLWDLMLERSRLCLTLGAGILLSVFSLCQNLVHLNTILFAFPLVAIGYALLIAGSIHQNSPMNRINLPIFYYLTQYTYAFYLVHKIGIHLTGKLMGMLGISVHSYMSIILSFLISLLFSMIMYYSIEGPILKRRGRWIKLTN